MGKTTTKFTGDIVRLTLACQVEIDKLNVLIAQRRPLNQMAKTLIAAMDEACERHMPGGQQTEGCEERLEKDPIYVRSAAQLDQINQRIMLCDGKIRTAKGALRVALKALSDENTKFEVYVKAKKSKWFGSKNSVPAAEACIKGAKDFIDNNRPLLQ